MVGARKRDEFPVGHVTTLTAIGHATCLRERCPFCGVDRSYGIVGNKRRPCAPR